MYQRRLAGTARATAQRNQGPFTRRGQRIINNGNQQAGVFAHAFEIAEAAVAPPAPVNTDQIPPAHTHTATPAVNAALQRIDETAGINTRSDTSPQRANEDDDPSGQQDPDGNTSNERGPNERLRRIRVNFTVEGIRRNVRSDSTFSSHQRNNERLILFLYHGEEGQYRAMVTDELCHRLDDIKTGENSELSFYLSNPASWFGQSSYSP
jgi:hypothetical protein